LRFTGGLDQIMSDFNQTFDLTTKEGHENALTVFLMVNPPMAAAVWLGKTLFDGISTLTSGANEKETEEQRKVAIDIIKAGKENGADEIEITMSQKAGIGLGSDVDGVPIELLRVLRVQ
jgi:hypothetical protein